MLSKAIFAIAILGLSLNATAQEKLSPYSVGVFGGYLLNNHSADFKKIPDCPSCSPGYKSGSGSGFALGGLFEYKYSPLLSFGGRISVRDLSATLERAEPTTVIIEGVQTPGEFTHYVETSLMAVSFQPLAKLTFFDSFNFSVGPTFSSLTKYDYSQREEITKPKGVGTFINNGVDTKKRTRNELSGELENIVTPLISLDFSLSYTLPMNKNKTLLLEPELAYSIGLTNIIDATETKKWKTNYFSLGAAIRYVFPEAREIIRQRRRQEQIDTIIVSKDLITGSYVSRGVESSREVIEMLDGVEMTTTHIARTDTLFNPRTYNITADIRAVGIDSNGTEVANPKIIVEEFTSNKMKPLLNYIFFEENSAEIPGRYKSMTSLEASKFNLNDLYSYETLDIYYYILNIIGRRLTDRPGSKITLVGCNSDYGAEKGNSELSNNRANAVKNYLTSIWGIEPNRIAIEKRNLPEKASTPLTDPEKIQENRRVEFYSDNYEVLSPIFLADTVRTANPPIVRFYPQVNCEAGLSTWTLAAFQTTNNGKVSFEKSGSDMPPRAIDWEVASVNSLTPKLAQPINYRISATDKIGKEIETAIKELPFELVTISRKRELGVKDKLIESYSLILFDFDKSDIVGTNKKIIDFLKKRITPESVITILGYSDRTGEDEYNKRLSEKRANAVKSAIDKKSALIENVGEDKLLYNNDVPEGRFYCRTVDIIVETPISQSQGKK